MKRFRLMAAALCAAVLLCAFGAPAYAYASGGEGEDYGDPTMETPAPEPEPTIEPGEGFEEEGNLVTRDLLYDEHTNKQFITVQTAGGSTFYIVIDYDKPVDEEGEQYETYFLNMGVEPEPEPAETEEPAPEEAEPETDGNMGTLLLILAVAVIGGGAAVYFKVIRPKRQKDSEPEDDDAEPEDYEDDGPPWDEDEPDENSEEEEQ